MPLSPLKRCVAEADSTLSGGAGLTARSAASRAGTGSDRLAVSAPVQRCRHLALPRLGTSASRSAQDRAGPPPPDTSLWIIMIPVLLPSAGVTATLVPTFQPGGFSSEQSTASRDVNPSDLASQAAASNRYLARFSRATASSRVLIIGSLHSLGRTILGKSYTAHLISILGACRT